MARVFVTRRLPGPALERLRAAGHEVDVWAERLPPDPAALRRRVAGADGLLALLTDRIDAELLDAAPRLRVIANYAVGYDNIDLDAAAARDVAVGNTPDVLTDATADLTFALLLAAARRIVPAVEQASTGDWLTWETEHHLGSSAAGGALTIVGPGRIGRAVAARAGGFGMRVRTVGRKDDLAAALGGADFVSLHCPLTPQTRGLIDAEALAVMSRDAILVNTARGPIVDQPALLAAVRAGEIAGAALDVTDPEPPAPDDPVLHTPGVLVTPHIGSATRAARERMADLAVENLLAALDGEPMPYPVSAS
jgi:glyoxylate reductase